MNSADLTADQIDALKKQLRPMITFMLKLHERMTAQQFPAIDQLRLRTLTALDQLEARQAVLEQLAKDRTARDDYLLDAKSRREYKRRLREKRNG